MKWINCPEFKILKVEASSLRLVQVNKKKKIIQIQMTNAIFKIKITFYASTHF